MDENNQSSKLKIPRSNAPEEINNEKINSYQFAKI
jgi:hypothetical protein